VVSSEVNGQPLELCIPQLIQPDMEVLAVLANFQSTSMSSSHGVFNARRINSKGYIQNKYAGHE
jgi:hypothetical protein